MAPPTEQERRLAKARTAATDALLAAEAAEAEARRARRRASARQSHYERLLREWQGEQALPFPTTNT